MNILYHECKALLPISIHPRVKPLGFNFTIIPVPCAVPIENALDEYIKIQKVALECAIVSKIISIAETKKFWLTSVLDTQPWLAYGPIINNPTLGATITTRTIISDYACQLETTLLQHLYSAIIKCRQFEFEDCLNNLNNLKVHFAGIYTTFIADMELPEELEKYRDRYLQLGLESFAYYISQTELVALP